MTPPDRLLDAWLDRVVKALRELRGRSDGPRPLLMALRGRITYPALMAAVAHGQRSGRLRVEAGTIILTEDAR